MNEILPGVFHWSAFKPNIGQVVHSHYYAPARTVFDPWLPDDSEPVLAELRERGVDQVVLSCRHHWRSSSELDAPVLAHEAGLHEFENSDREATGYTPPADLGPGLRALEFGAICPDDAALLLETEGGALLFGDGVIVWNGKLSFVPDFLLGDPEADKRALLGGLRRLLDEATFESLLFAHGDPWIEGGRAALQAFVAEGGRSTSFSG
jgi:glyoxylase-like metal-dependent hydrolase (beta-lactamase superfamily II)